MNGPGIASIVLIEDDDVAAEAMMRAFRKHGLSNPIIHAQDGAEGLAMLRGTHADKKARKPYLVLLDLNMPGMNGFEFLAELRADEELTETVVFVLTTSDLEKDKRAAYRHHVAGYMVKSIVGADSRKTIEMLQHYWLTISLPSS